MTEQEQAAEQMIAAIRQVKLHLVENFKKEVAHSPALTKSSLIFGYMRGLDDMFAFIGKKGVKPPDAPAETPS